MSSTSTSYYRAIHDHLPPAHAARLTALCTDPSSRFESLLDTLIRFATGAPEYDDDKGPTHNHDHPDSASADRKTQWEWKERQISAKKALDSLYHGQRQLDAPFTNTKRGRRGSDEEDEAEVGQDSLKNSNSRDGTTSKRQRVSNNHPTAIASIPPGTPDHPLFTLYSVSTTSPIRKKINITIHLASIHFTHPTTHTLEALVPLSTLHRAFITPTRGKSRPHWTVILLPSDSSNHSAPKSSAQVIFGIDAHAQVPISVATHLPTKTTPLADTTETFAKGAATYPLLHRFLSHLPVHALPVMEPSAAVFRSACAGSSGAWLEGGGGGGVPGVEAYRGAKAGSLWFFKEGILWGDSKPCEFWSLEDLMNGSDGVRLVSATGRTCSVILTRKGEDGDGRDVASGDEGVETEFGMVDGKEQAGINQWVREHRHLFGKKVDGAGGAKNRGEKGVEKMANTNVVVEDDSDGDEDFEVDSADSDGGSPSNESSPDDDEDGREEGEGGEEGDEDDGEGEELLEENHPLLRPGAMRRISRAAIDSVVNMMEEDLRGQEESGDEEDELDGVL